MRAFPRPRLGPSGKRELLSAATLLLVFAAAPHELQAKLGPISAAALARPDADFDGDGLTNSEELARGSDPHDDDTDGDGVPDAQDGWPRHDWITRPPLPETHYATVSLRALGFPQTGSASALNNRNDVLGIPSGFGSPVLWDAASFQATQITVTYPPTPPGGSIVFRLNPSYDETCFFYAYPGNSLYLSNEGHVAGFAHNTTYPIRRRQGAWSILPRGDSATVSAYVGITAVNSSGTVIGFKRLSAYPHTKSPALIVAVRHGARANGWEAPSTASATASIPGR